MHDYDAFPYKWEPRLLCPTCKRPGIHSIRDPRILWCDVCGVTSATGGEHWSLVPATRDEWKEELIEHIEEIGRRMGNWTEGGAVALVLAVRLRSDLGLPPMEYPETE